MGVVRFTYQIPEKSIGGCEIDCFLNEHITHSNSITDIPVEDGDNIADHVIENADEVQVKAFIGKVEFQEWKGKIPESEADIPAEDPKARIKEKYLEFLKLKRERQPVDVVMGLATFNNMVITSFDIDRNVETGADLSFDMSFKSVRIVKSETTTINASSTGPAGDQVAGPANKGTEGTNKVDPDSPEAKKEWQSWVQRQNLSRDALLDYEEKWGVPYPQ
jgi:hypothetical protein